LPLFVDCAFKLIQETKFQSQIRVKHFVSNRQLIEDNQKLNVNSELKLKFTNLVARELRIPTKTIVGYIDINM